MHRANGWGGTRLDGGRTPCARRRAAAVGREQRQARRGEMLVQTAPPMVRSKARERRPSGRGSGRQNETVTTTHKQAAIR